VEYARHAFRLLKPGEDGVALRDKLEHIAETTGIVDEALNLPSFPTAIQYLWGWFHELQSARTGNGFGANPITFSEIQAWMQLTGRTVHPWEINALKELDRAYLVEVSSNG
jgi:hypothetical protein